MIYIVMKLQYAYDTNHCANQIASNVLQNERLKEASHTFHIFAQAKISFN